MYTCICFMYVCTATILLFKIKVNGIKVILILQHDSHFLQYPKGLGNTVKELDISKAVGKFEKTRFSMLIPEVEKTLETLCDGDIKHVVLFGIEVHYEKIAHAIYTEFFQL